MTRYASLSYANKFTFVCPIFNVETAMAACVRTRDKTIGSNDPYVFDKRKGCQAAMHCGLCPAAAMMQMYWQNKAWDNDHHGSFEPKKGRLHAQVLEKIVRVIPTRGLYRRTAVSPREEELLHSARERIEEQLKTAPGETISKRHETNYEAPKRKKRAAPPKVETPAPDNTINQAARSGDMSAALNAA